MKKFERIALGAIVFMVLGFFITAGFLPINTHTSAPHAYFEPIVADFEAAASKVFIEGLKEEGQTQNSKGPIFEGVEQLEQDNSLEIVSVGSLKTFMINPSAPTAKDLSETFIRIGYDLEKVRAGTGLVPQLFLASMPRDLSDVQETQNRKNLFFQTMLPLILQANEEILDSRLRLRALMNREKYGQYIHAADRLWLYVMAERYKVKRGDHVTLLERIDIIAPSLALAQAVEESGWGSSRFAREGNVIFGQWTYDPSAKGIVPTARDAGKKHKIKAFDTMLDSVRAYMWNLNTHRAYVSLRKVRKRLRHTIGRLDGSKMAQGLMKYSERGSEYVEGLRSIISVNKLERFDRARLEASLGDFKFLG